MRVQAKDKFATVLKACNFIKKRLLAGCFPVSIPNVLGTIFLQNNYGEFLKNKVSGEIVFDLISLFHYNYETLQAVQLRQEHLSFLQSFIITNYLEI